MGMDDVISADRVSKVEETVTTSLMTEIPRYGKG
jgi:hypothetical protein